LPLNASIPFGYYFFNNNKYDFLSVLIASLTYPIGIIEKSLPFGSFLLFILLFAGVVRNPKIPYFVRYNACQAILINIALIIITILIRILPIFELDSIISIVFSIIFISILSIFIYSFSQCISGFEPEIPFISKSVRMQI
tara:strand:+ start:402 stop:821 length:420 start_codon:yes stop_codon:yes gene_type:complete